MRMRAFIIGLSLVVALTQVAAADQQHMARSQYMAETLAGCKNFMRVSQDRLFSYQEGYSEGDCTGTIAGIDEAAEDICLPDGADFDQMVRVVIKYIEERPQRWHERFPKLAHEALKAAWPCKQ
jgi:Rap1a immunity proteins